MTTKPSEQTSANALVPLRRLDPTNTHAGVIVPEYRPSTSPEESEGVLVYWHLVYRRKGTVLVLAALGALIGYLISLPQPSLYRASASLEVLEVNDSFLNMGNLDPNNSRNYSAETRLHTEMRMLQSHSLTRQVAKRLQKSDIAFKAEPGAIASFFGSWTALNERPTRDSAIRLAAASVKVRNPDLTRIVEITTESSDPKIAAEFANVLTETYMQQTIEGRLDNTKRTREWLDKQIGEVKGRLQTIEGDLFKYAQASGITQTDDAPDRLRRLQDQLSQAQASLIEKASALQVATAVMPDSVPEVHRDDLVKVYSQRLFERRVELSQLATVLSPEHYKIKRLRTEISDLEQLLSSEQSRVVKRLQNEYEAARVREQMQRNAYTQETSRVTVQDSKKIHYNLLKREAESLRQLYDSMLQKVKEAEIASAVRASNVRVVDPAEPPKFPYKPNPMRNALTGFTTGAFVAVIFLSIRNSFDRRLRRPGEVSAFLQVPELGAIPSFAAKGLIRKKADPLWKPEQAATISGTRVNADSFGSVLVSLLSRQIGQRVFTVTSPNANEGKTSILFNLGIALAEIGKQVLLIDGDLRNPRLHEIFDVSNSWGLSDLLSGNVPVDQFPPESLAKPTSISKLSILPSGPGTDNIARLLYSPAAKMLLSRLEQQFDIILIDTPPALRFPDARILAANTAGTILVFRAGQTDRDSARHIIDRLFEDGVPVVGVILNDWDRHANESRRYGDGDRV